MIQRFSVTCPLFLETSWLCSINWENNHVTFRTLELRESAVRGSPTGRLKGLPVVLFLTVPPWPVSHSLVLNAACLCAVKRKNFQCNAMTRGTIFKSLTFLSCCMSRSDAAIVHSNWNPSLFACAADLMEPHSVPGGQTKYQPATRGQPAVLVWFSFKSKMCIANHPDDLGLAEPTSCLLCFSSADLLGAWMKWQEWKVWPEVEQQVRVHSELTCWLACCTRMSNAHLLTSHRFGLSPVLAKGNRFSYWCISPPGWFSFRSIQPCAPALHGLVFG